MSLCEGDKSSGVTRGGLVRAPPGHCQSLPDHQEKKNLVISIIYTISDAFFQDRGALLVHPRFSGLSINKISNYTTNDKINRTLGF